MGAMPNPSPSTKTIGLRAVIISHLSSHPESAAKLEKLLKLAKFLLAILGGLAALAKALGTPVLWKIDLSWLAFGLIFLSALVAWLDDLWSIHKNKVKDERARALEMANEDWELKVKEGVDRGFSRCLSEWSRISGYQESAMYNLSRQVSPILTSLSKSSHGSVSGEALDSNLLVIHKIFTSLYQDKDGNISINLVRKQNKNTFNMIRIYPGNNGRGLKIPRQIRHGSKSGYATAYRSGEFTAHHFDTAPSASGYCSVASLPVKGPNGQVLGVVNVDSPRRNLFADREQLEIAHNLCLGSLTGIAIVLSDKRLELRSGEVVS